jgi:hypothetical protein
MTSWNLETPHGVIANSIATAQNSGTGSLGSVVSHNLAVDVVAALREAGMLPAPVSGIADQKDKDS